MNQLRNQTIEENLARAVVAVKTLARMGCTVQRVEVGVYQPRIYVDVDTDAVLHGCLVKTIAVDGAFVRLYVQDVEGCHVQWEIREAWDRRSSAAIPAESNDELSPYSGERMRDVLHDIRRNGVDA